ncbi:cytochrome [Spongiactinospora rosea]|uniref:Cytochrome n=1 Tax=Spongiactinospora rosea TaxID=2248750 RepID=A0A366LNT0_9ACTN|nr:cytochrome P450 [Spongiactinospora rosea]RBQ15300.1 cytochrome [Spongiactinospora rosea]
MSPTISVDVLQRLAAPEERANPYPFLHWLRENEPVHLTTAGFYLLSRHGNVQWALQNTGNALTVPGREDLRHQFPQADRHRAVAIQLDAFASKHESAYTGLRKLMSRDLSVKNVEGLQADISAKCERLLDAITERLRDGEVVDFHETVSRPLTIEVFADLFSVPEDVRDRLSSDVVEVMAALEARDEDTLNSADAAAERVEAYFREEIEQRRRAPGDDLLSTLVTAHDGTARPGDDRLMLGLLWVMWMTGYDSTAAGIDRGLQAMLDHPDQLYWLRGSYDEAAAFVEEALRHDGVVLFTPIPRVATTDIEFDGHTLPKGAPVRMVLAAANRDPEVFSDPDRFDPGRNHNATLSMGYGMYYCNGAALVRTEMNILLTMMHRRFPQLSAAGEPVWTQAVGTAIGTRGVDHLPIRLT